MTVAAIVACPDVDAVRDTEIHQREPFLGGVEHGSTRGEKLREHRVLDRPSRNQQLRTPGEHRCSSGQNHRRQQRFYCGLQIAQPPIVALLTRHLYCQTQLLSLPRSCAARASIKAVSHDTMILANELAKPSGIYVLVRDLVYLPAKSADPLGHEVDLGYGRQTADAQGPRDSGPEAGRLPARLEKGRQARKVTPPPPEEVASKTALARRRGGYSARRTRSGSPADA
jgi:hypothetical protein